MNNQFTRIPLLPSAARKALSFLCLFALTAMLPPSLLAGTAVDFTAVQSQIREEKGAAAASSKWSLAGEQKPSLDWTVETTPAEEFDFARLTIPCEAEITADSVVVLSGALTILPDHFLDIELVTDAGTSLYAAISKPTDGENDYRLPMEKFSVTDGSEKVLPTAITAIKIMISGDKSPDAGPNHAVISGIAIE